MWRGVIVIDTKEEVEGRGRGDMVDKMWSSKGREEAKRCGCSKLW
jgi:hypothetical protein